ncbi:unnamed protein product [Cylindrotheca closterium]|uniref:Uncharacterized protein n=1 Tax=Cylindrotheca closterium TaxID=2856 RepID=A0AAD2FWK6_9STRA|nr:unnamed protein product [Cylindrotheca closterium]
MDPPGHTVFLHLQELNRSELQAQAKLYGIKANQKSEVLRQQLQEILAARGNVNSPAPSVAVLEEAEEEEARDDEDAQKKDDEEQEENEENEPVDVKEDTEEEAMAPTVEEKGEDEEEVEQPTNTTIEEADEKKEEARVDDDVVAMKTEDVEEAVAPTVEEEEELLEQPTSSTDIEVNENEDQIEVAVAQQEKDHEESTTVNEMESKHGSSAWVEAEDDKEEEEEENTVEDAKKELPQSDNVEQEETENEESNAAPPLLVIVDLGSDEMADLADESIVSPTAAAKEMFRSKIPSGPSSSSGRGKALEERLMLRARTIPANLEDRYHDSYEIVYTRFYASKTRVVSGKKKIRASETQFGRQAAALVSIQNFFGVLELTIKHSKFFSKVLWAFFINVSQFPQGLPPSRPIMAFNLEVVHFVRSFVRSFVLFITHCSKGCSFEAFRSATEFSCGCPSKGTWSSSSRSFEEGRLCFQLGVRLVVLFVVLFSLSFFDMVALSWVPAFF